MRRGVAYGVMAGALWGMVFLVPRVLPDFSPLLLSTGRYTMYGIVSLAAALPVARPLLRRLTREDLGALVKFALVGNLLYYLLLTAAVHTIGIAPSSLIVGVLPVTVTLLGRRDHGAVPLSRLAWPLAMVVAGIACINVDVFTAANGTQVSLPTKLLGLACVTGALGCWSWFAVENARYLQRHTHFSGNEWSMLWGVVTGALGAALWAVIAVLPHDWVLGGLQSGVHGAVHSGVHDGLLAGIAALGEHRWESFWLLNLGLAIGASWLGNGLWNAASTRLPLTLSGQLIVFETLFALLYGFIYDQRWPRPLETAAIVLLVAGVSWSVRRHAGGDSGSDPRNDPDSREARAALRNREA